MRIRTLLSFALGFVAGGIFTALLLYNTGRWHLGVTAAPGMADRALPEGPKLPDTSVNTPPNYHPQVPQPAIEPLPSSNSEADDLMNRRLLIPVQGVDQKSILDTFNDARGGGSRKHEAVDILAPKGTPVIAADDGNVVKLFKSKAGGLTVYQFDNSQTWCYYYAHLDHYPSWLKEGMLLHKGDIVGYVGNTGDASTTEPHLHFAINKLGADKKWWEGTPINPYQLLHH